MIDDLRPSASVEVTCACGVSFWIEALHPSLPDGPFVCAMCSGEPIVLARKQELHCDQCGATSPFNGGPIPDVCAACGK